MVKTKTTPHGGKSHCPRGMAAATFASGAEADPEEQYEDTSGEETEDTKTGQI